MDCVADQAFVAGRRSPLLPTTSFVAPSARVTTVTGDPGYPHVALALALGGRLPLTSGRIALDGDDAIGLRRHHVALVDVEGVTAPEAGLPLRTVLAEELAFAHRPSGRREVEALLERLAISSAHTHFDELPPPDRVRLLMEVAAQRAATRILVVAHPDRAGGDPTLWWPTLEQHAADGLTVIALVTLGTAAVLGIEQAVATGEPEVLGRHEAPRTPSQSQPQPQPQPQPAPQSQPDHTDHTDPIGGEES